MNLCGPVIEKDGKLWPRAYGSNRIISGGTAVDNNWIDAVTKLDRMGNRADDEPPFSE